MKQCILLSLLFVSIEAFAQVEDDYRPFVEQGKVWYHFAPTTLGTIRMDIMEGDTIVGGKHCVKWLQQCNAYSSGTRWFQVCAYEEDKKVWFYYDGEDVPRLFFDFGAQVGDTVNCHVANAFWHYQLSFRNYPEEVNERYYHDSIIVSGKRTEIVGERTQRIFLFYHLSEKAPNFSGGDMMIEGVGSRNSPSGIGMWSDNMTQYGLIYCAVNDEILYIKSNYAEQYGIIAPTSITSSQIINTESSNSKYFDLSGRRLSTPPAKGLYIENGKKRVAR